jgi:hypothetical protein
MTGTRRAAPRPLRARVVAVLLVLATLGAGRVMLACTPDTDEREQPFVVAGAVGEGVDVRTFTLTVLGVRGGPKVTAYGKEYDTSGVWVVVRVRVEAAVEPSTAGYAAVRDGRGRTFRATERFPQTLVGGGRRAQPGVPLEADVVFEVPPAAATDLALRVADNSFDRRMDVEAEVQLPIDAATVRRWLATTEPLLVARDSVV